MTRHCYRLMAGCAAFGIILAVPAQALEFDPAIQLTGVYTDNVRLAEENEESDLIGVVTPSLVVAHTSPRVDWRMALNYEWLWYDDASEDASFWYGETDFELNLIQDRFFFSGYARQDQIAKDPTQPIPNTNLPLSNNRTDALVYEVTPRIFQPILGLELDAQATFGTIDYDEPPEAIDADGDGTPDATILQDTDYIRTASRLGGRDTGRRLTWSLNHEYTRYEYELPPESVLQIGFLELDYLLGNSGLSVFGDFGYESPYEEPSESAMDDPFWRGGIRRQGPRMQLELFGGRRSYGPSYGATLRYQLKSGALILGYEDSPQRQEDLFASRPLPTDPVVPDLPPDLDVPGTGSVFVRKLLDASFIWVANRNEITTRAYFERREDDVAQNGQPLDSKRKQFGINLDWIYRAGSKTDIQFLAGFNQRDINTPANRREDDTIVARLAWIRKFTQRSLVSAYVAHQQLDSKTSKADEYKANEIGILFSQSFGDPSIRGVERSYDLFGVGDRNRD